MKLLPAVFSDEDRRAEAAAVRERAASFVEHAAYTALLYQGMQHTAVVRGMQQ